MTYITLDTESTGRKDGQTENAENLFHFGKRLVVAKISFYQLPAIAFSTIDISFRKIHLP